MDYITLKEAGHKWGISSRMVSYYCQENKIKGALKKGNLWLIPADAKPPDGMRRKLPDTVTQPVKRTQETLRIPTALKKQLQAITMYPLTIVTGPSGIGKTTAVDEYCKTIKPMANIYWYTCLGEPLTQFWRGICHMYRQFDEKMAERLVKLGPPKMDNLGEISCILQDCICKKEIIIIIDNYQYMIREISGKIMDAISLYSPDNIHLVIISQDDFIPNHTPQNEKIHFIQEDYFSFSKHDIDLYFQKIHIKLGDEQLEHLLSTSKGWVSALKLERSYFSETGELLGTRAIKPLIQSMIWNQIDPQQQEFLMAASLMEGFTPSQAKILSGRDALPQEIQTMLRENSFIRYVPDGDTYVMHHLLSGFIHGVLARQPSDLTNRLWKRAGDAFVHEKKYFRAIQCFFHIPDYLSILNLPCDKDDLDLYSSNETGDLIRKIITNCPEETLSGNPLLVLSFAFQLLVSKNFRKVADKIFRVIDLALQDTARWNGKDSDTKEIKAVTAVLRSYLGFNDIYKIGEGYQKAYELLKGPLPLEYANQLGVFKQPSVLYLYWAKPGELQRTLRGYECANPAIQDLLPHRALGANYAIQAEAQLLLGNSTDAEIFCHRCLYYSSSADCSYVYYTAELTLSRIAILRGDYAMLKQSLKNMEKYHLAHDTQKHKAVYRLAHSFVLTLLGDDDVNRRLMSVEEIKANVNAISIPFAYIVYSKWMLLQERYTELLGLLDIFSEAATRPDRFQLANIYFAIFRAVSLNRLNRRAEAKEAFQKALALASPDKVYMPFAEHGDVMTPLLMAGIGASYKADIQKIRMLYQTLRSGINTIKELSFESFPGLTKREREVALLAKEGLSNHQIAELLSIGDETVKKFMKHIFTKLNLTSRIQLQYIDF